MSWILEAVKSRAPRPLLKVLRTIKRRVSPPPLIIERMEVDLVVSRLQGKPHLRILDIGSHHGELLDILERLHGSHIHNAVCVEPFAANVRTIRSKRRGYRRVSPFVIQAAVSDVTERKTFIVGSADTLITCSSEHAERFGEHFASPSRFEVDGYTVADLFRRFEIPREPRLDLVKVDVEGHDMEVVRSFIESGIDTFALMFEVCETARETDEIVGLLTAAGFREFFLFGRSGISTNYLGEYPGEVFLEELLRSGRITTGNVVAIRDVGE